MSEGNYLTVNDVVNNYGIIIAASEEETPCGNNYVVAFNGKYRLSLFAVIDGGCYEIDERNSDVDLSFWKAICIAKEWINNIITQEAESVEG
jgi:hypothetical protein